MNESICSIKKTILIFVLSIMWIPNIHGTRIHANEQMIEEVKLPEFYTEYIPEDIIENEKEIQEDIIEEEIIYTELEVCSTTSSFKSYMDYRAITNTNSEQYILQTLSYTDNGYRIYEGRYVVAMANKYVGQKLDIELSSGEILPVVIGDIKAGTSCSHQDGSIIEFIVDTNTMDPFVKQMGNYNVIHEGTVVSIYQIG